MSTNNVSAMLPLPRGYFYLGNCLCVRIPVRGGWRVATDVDKMEMRDLQAVEVAKSVAANVKAIAEQKQAGARK